MPDLAFALTLIAGFVLIILTLRAAGRRSASRGNVPNPAGRITG